jgi:two-component system chemotaxis response regulator CheY
MKILVVDDDRITRLLLRKILSKNPTYEVVEAVTGLEAWNLMDQGAAPDLTILDIMMPGLDGMQLLTKIRTDPRFRNLGVIMCTVVSETETVQQAAALGVSHYFVKPFSAQRVLEEVQKVFSKLPVNEPLEDPVTVSQRLGIDHESYHNLLQLLIEEVEKCIAEVRAALAAGDQKAAAWKISAIKDAATNLGAWGMVAVADKCERRLQSVPLVGFDIDLEEFECEFKRLAAHVNGLADKAIAF